MTDLSKLDAENRLKALELQSFIVEAPAGAGKTELLTQRYLKLLSRVHEPEEIIALTFTNKASAEMRNRIFQSLETAEKQIPVDAAHKQQTRDLANNALKQAQQRGWQLLTQPSRLRILTMDTLCSSLARQMPLLSRLGGQPRLVEDASAHYNEAAQLALSQVAQEENLQAPISTVLGFMQNDVEKLGKLLAQMLAKREQWLHLTGTQTTLEGAGIITQCQQALKACIEEKLRLALQSFPANYQAKLMPVVRFAASNLDGGHAYAQLIDWSMPLGSSVDSLPNWLVLKQFLLTKGNFRKANGLNVTFGFPANHPDKTKHLQTFADVCDLIADPNPLESLGDLPVISHDEIHENSIIVQAFAQLLQLAAAHLWTVFQTANEVDFVAIAQSAIYALENEQGPTDLALRLDYKISHLLVDEFQDTNATQMTLLEQLTQGWQPHDGRTLFCVGDPMQSIYRFRKADVSLFLQAAEHGIGQIQLNPLKLYRNNRSQPSVVEWINHTFENLFPSQDNEREAAIRYRPFIASCAQDADEGVTVHALTIEKNAERGDAKTLEARYIADLIKKEQKKNPTQKIAVLVRSRNHLRELVSEIHKNHPRISFQAVNIEELNQRQTVQDALSLTRAMLHRADRVHWLNILRAPWCGLTLADLHALCADNHHATIWQLMQEDRLLSEDGQLRLTHIKNVLNEAFLAQGRIPLRRWLESTWLKLGGGRTLVSIGDNRDVQAFFDLVEKLAQGYVLDFEQLETAMGKLYARPDVNATEHLQFLTIHGAKGLEFDCVILPALNRQARHPESPLMLWEKVSVNGKTQLLAAPFSKKKTNGTPTIYDYIKQLEALRANNETMRLLYVAATRTKRKLHLVATATQKEGQSSLAQNSFLALLWPKLEINFTYPQMMETPTQPTSRLAEYTSKLMRLAQVEPPSVFTVTAPKSDYTTVSIHRDEINHFLEVNRYFDADVGILTHFYLQLIVNRNLSDWNNQRLKNLHPVMHYWFISKGYADKISNEGALIVITHLETTLASAQGQWVLQSRLHAESELAIDYIENGQFSRKIIDRTFIEENTRWIIDYKTTPLDESIKPDAIKHVAENFRDQLHTYANLFKAEGLEVKCAIFFTNLGKLIIL
ncbi:MAG: UvrD-helicase domain-containing protein [Methylophilaceae bacterium]